METNPLENTTEDFDRPSRKLTAEQMEEFRTLVAKDMQLRAQRSQPEAQRTNMRGASVQPREHGGRVLRHLKQRGGY
jgi:hypothetical protein